MEFLRTPDHHFDHLPEYDFAPNYVDVDDTEGGMLRMHYIDEGPKDGEVIWMQHGEPSWAFLYRKMIKPLALSLIPLFSCRRAQPCKYRGTP